MNFEYTVIVMIRVLSEFTLDFEKISTSGFGEAYLKSDKRVCKRQHFHKSLISLKNHVTYDKKVVCE